MVSKHTVTMRSRGIGSQLLDLLFPPRCQVCGEFSDDSLCETCRETLLFIDAPRCTCCGRPLPAGEFAPSPGTLCEECRDGRWVSGARSVGPHLGTLRDAMLAYKFAGRRRLAELFGEMLAEVFAREVAGPERGLPLERCAALVPVPLHPKRRHWRGFDQAELLCEHITEALGLPVWDDAIARIRHTTPQTELTGASRRANVRGAFEARKPWRLARASVVLVDDVMTTGSTLEECARVLKTAGARSVYALTVTRAVPGWHTIRPGGEGAPPAGGDMDA